MVSEGCLWGCRGAVCPRVHVQGRKGRGSVAPEGGEWFQKAAKQGDAEAQLHLGSMYENGHGVQEDLAQAFQWYLKAAKQGNAVAQCLLAMMLEESDGDSQDVATAAE